MITDSSFDFSKKEKAYMKAAEAISKLSDHRCQIGCAIVNRHRIVSSGYSSNKKKNKIQKHIDTNYFNCYCEGKLHAETMALIPLLRAKADLSRATIYTYRETRNGDLAKSRPCPRCMQLIKKAGIKKLVYTTEDGVCKEKLIY